MAFVSTAPLPARRAPHLRPQRPARPRTELQPSCCARNVSRRVFLAAGAAVSAGFALLPAPRQQRASASGLLLFPLREPLYNEYYFVRAGETLNLGPTGPKVARTNPVEKTSVRLHGLTRRGVAQSLANAAALQDSFGLGPGAWIWYSQNNAANETAHIIASSLHVRNEQIVPEFSFLDARGVGALEGQPVSFAETEIAKIDAQSVSARMAPGEDGTPNESVEDVFVRVRQLLSKLETQYSGEEIVVVAPDSDTLSILEAVLKDIPLEKHRQMCGYAPGELRKIQPKIVTDA